VLTFPPKELTHVLPVLEAFYCELDQEVVAPEDPSSDRPRHGRGFWQVLDR